MAVTTVIPTIGRPSLWGAVASVLGQTVDDWRVIIVADGPEAGERADRVVGAIADPRISSLTAARQSLPEDDRERWRLAGTHPFNVGLGRARTTWFSYLADDDIYMPRHHELLLAAASTDVDCVYGQSMSVNRRGQTNTYGTRWPPERFDIVQGAYIMRRAAALRATEVPVGVAWDADWWTRHIGRIRFRHVKEEVVHLYFPDHHNLVYQGLESWQ